MRPYLRLPGKHKQLARECTNIGEERPASIFCGCESLRRIDYKFQNQKKPASPALSTLSTSISQKACSLLLPVPEFLL